MYRAALESILGFKLQGDRLEIDPCIPRFWREFEITYRHGPTTYRIKVENPQSLCRGVASITVDGTKQEDDLILLSRDGLTHEARVLMGEKAVKEETERIGEEAKVRS